MPASILEQYRVADILDWNENKQLKLNPDFQRRAVWSRDAQVFLIDTILRRLPVPKIYMRTKVDLATKKSFREVVDGQQRLRAILDFAHDKFTLTKRAKEFEGVSYSTLPDDLKEVFLSYPLAVDQLLNASDSDVLEIFARLNSYNVVLNDAERRHAEFDTDFKWSIHESSKRWRNLWEVYDVVSTKQRVRMADDSIMAELYGVLLQGVTDGGQPKIRKLYEKYRSQFTEQQEVEAKIDHVLSYIVNNFNEVLVQAIVARAPHFLMLFAATAHCLFGIPSGGFGDDMLERPTDGLSNCDITKQNIAKINQILESDEPEDMFMSFWIESKGSTQRIKSRKIRFPLYLKALRPEVL